MAFGGVEIGRHIAELAAMAIPMRTVLVPPRAWSLAKELSAVCPAGALCYAAEGVELVTHTSADDGEDRDEQCGRGRVGDEVGEDVADKARNQENHDRTPFAKRDALQRRVCQSATIHTEAKGETTGYHPNHTPVDLLQVLGRDDTRDGKDANRHHGHIVGVDTRDRLRNHPQEDGDDEGHDDHIHAPSVVDGTLDLQFDGLLREREEEQKDAPRDDKQDDDEREHEAIQ